MSCGEGMWREEGILGAFGVIGKEGESAVGAVDLTRV